MEISWRPSEHDERLALRRRRNRAETETYRPRSSVNNCHNPGETLKPLRNGWTLVPIRRPDARAKALSLRPEILTRENPGASPTVSSSSLELVTRENARCPTARPTLARSDSYPAYDDITPMAFHDKPRARGSSSPWPERGRATSSRGAARTPDGGEPGAIGSRGSVTRASEGGLALCLSRSLVHV